MRSIIQDGYDDRPPTSVMRGTACGGVLMALRRRGHYIVIRSNHYAGK